MVKDLMLEQEWIRRARNGDDEAFAQLVHAYTPEVYRVVRRVATDSAEAEALVQEAFLRLWRKLSTYREQQPLFPYLVSIALNLGRDQWRRERLVNTTGLEDDLAEMADPQPDPETQVEEAELLQKLAHAVAALPHPYRAVIALRYEAGMEYQEIAQVLHLPVNTVRTHLHRAKAYLKRLMEGREENHGSNGLLAVPTPQPIASE